MDFLFLFLQVITGAQTKRQVINCKKFLLYNCCVVIYIKINRCSSLYFYLIENSLIFSFFSSSSRRQCLYEMRKSLEQSSPHLRFPSLSFPFPSNLSLSLFSLFIIILSIAVPFGFGRT